jgi:hypothetical protein
MLVWAFVDSFRSAKWGLFESALLVSGVYSLQIVLGLWYQVGMRDGVIWQRAFGSRRVLLPISDISSVGEETSDIKTLAPTLPHVILLPDASPAMLPASLCPAGFEGFYLS